MANGSLVGGLPGGNLVSGQGAEGGLLGGGPSGGGAVGGVMGDAGLSLQMHKVPIVGPLLFRNPNEEFMKQQMHQAALSQMARRPMMADAYMNALRQSTSAMQPVNNMLGGMYGAGAMMDPSQLYQNPIPPQAYANPQFGAGPPPSGVQPGPLATGSGGPLGGLLPGGGGGGGGGGFLGGIGGALSNVPIVGGLFG